MHCFRQILQDNIYWFKYKIVFCFIVCLTLTVKVLSLFLIYVHLWSWWKLNISVLQPTPDPWASVHPHLKKDQEIEHTKCAKLHSRLGQEPKTWCPGGPWGLPPKRTDFSPRGPHAGGRDMEIWETTHGQCPFSVVCLRGETFWDQLPSPMGSTASVFT